LRDYNGARGDVPLGWEHWKSTDWRNARALRLRYDQIVRVWQKIITKED
jgi:hypothetical protein